MLRLNHSTIVSLDRLLRIATLNVRGLAAGRRQNQLYRLVTEQDLDVVAIQETKVEGEDQTERMVRPFTARYDACVSHAVGKSAGCVLFVRKCLGAVIHSVVTCELGRLVVCDFSFEDREWRIICVYAPTRVQERRIFFESVRHYCDTERVVCLLGDFNCVCSAHDKTSSTPYQDSSTVLLSDIVNDYGLEDVGECVNSGRGVQFTHFQGTSHSRLDRAYVSLEVVPFCFDYTVCPISFSDHCLVKFCVGKKSGNRKIFSWDLWKLNCKLLDDDIFRADVEAAIEKLRDVKACGYRLSWEHFKQEIKMKALERASIIKNEEKKIEKVLRLNLEMLVKEECRMPGACKDDICSVKEKLEILDKERYRGALVRARAERFITGEAPTKRALSLEKRYARRNEITEVECDGAVTSDRVEIERAFFDYYCTLFAASPVDVESFKRDFLPLMPRLDNATKEVLEATITAEDVLFAIEALNPGKSPGPDGLSAAFYKALKHELSIVLAKVFNEAFELGVLPPSFLSSHTILIPKTEDPVKLRQVTSYRPISLTNVDYKILMKILARRLQTVITEIVGPHQTCGIKGRTILTNIHKARSVLECCDAMQSGVAMLQIDLEKAFDRVPHDVLLAVLDHVNIGSVIREGVRMAYSGCTTRLVINHSVGKRIQVQRSVRQGCPLSPLLFCLYLESLCLSIIRHDIVSGFKLFSSEVRVLAYADDIAIFCTNHESIISVVNIVKHFCRVSGSAVNWHKCLGFWHGEWSVTPSAFANVKWVTTPVKYLGVPLEYYRVSEEYWRSQSVVLREKAEKWRGNGFSMFARATVCNLFLVSKLWYVLQVLHCSRVNVQKLHRVFAVFIWGSSWERTSRMNLFRRVREGGLGLSHLFLRQLVNRYCYFRDVSYPFLRTVCQVRLGRCLPEFVVSSSSVPGGIHGYLKEVVASCRFLAARFSLEYLSVVPRKRLYKDVCDAVFPVPLYRTMYSTGPGQDVLKRVKKMLVPPGVKSFFFKLHTGTLPVKTWMEERGLFVPWGVHCFLCKKPETIEHVFLECWDGVFLWDVLQRTLKKDFPLDSHGIRYLPVENEGGAPFDLVMLLGLHGIWRSRMAVRHADRDMREAKEYFRESIISFIEVHKAQKCAPEWLPCIEKLVNMSKF